MTLRNYEFNGLPEGEVEVRHESDSVFTLRPKNRDFIVPFNEMLQTKRPLAFKRLSLRYKDSQANRLFFEFQISRGFIKCNFIMLDNHMDIDENGTLRTEYILCPRAGECPDYGIVCNGHEETLLRKSEVEVLRLIVAGHDNKEIAELLCKSVHTIHNHRNNMLDRTGEKNTAGLVRYWYENNLK